MMLSFLTSEAQQWWGFHCLSIWLFVYLSACFWNRVSCHQGWYQIHFVGNDGFELQIFLPCPTKYWDYKHAPLSMALWCSDGRQRLASLRNYLGCTLFCSPDPSAQGRHRWIDFKKNRNTQSQWQGNTVFFPLNMVCCLTAFIVSFLTIKALR